MATIPISDGVPKDTYTAAAGQTIFPYTFWIRKESHIAVYVNGTLKKKTTDYAISDIQSPTGANVVFNSGLVENDEVVLVYDPAFERTTKYTGTIRLEALNTELTYLLTLLQSNKRKIDDAIRTADTETASFAGELPSLTGNGGKVLSLKSDLSGIEYKTVAAADTIISNYEEGAFDGNNSTTVFTLPFAPAAQNALLIWVGDVRQRPGTDYTISGTSLTFTTAPPTGTGNIVYLNTGAATSVNTPADGSVTSVKLASDAVTTDKIAAGAVGTTDLADDAVTLAKMEHSTQGEILYYGASGVPTRLSPGTAGQVLQTAGVGANPLWIDSASGGLVLLGSYTASSDTSVDIGDGLDLDAAIDGTYDIYDIFGVDVIPATDNVTLQARTSTDGGSSFDSSAGNYKYANVTLGSGDASSVAETSTSATSILMQRAGSNIGNDSSEGVSFHLRLFSPSNTATQTRMSYTLSFLGTGGNINNVNGSAQRATAGDVDALRIFMSSGNISSGTFYLYGTKKS